MSPPRAPLRPVADRVSPRRRRPHGALQLALRAPHGGVFVLRIEDTDVERSSWEMVAGIVDGMRWLGLDWDEGPDVGGPHGPVLPVRSASSGTAAAAERLVADGRAYYCYCTPEALKAQRDAPKQAGDRVELRPHVRAADARADRRARSGRHAARHPVPACRPGRTRFDDLVHGPIEFDNANIEDFVVLRSDGHPTYHLSVVVDDIDMAITHVVRGDDHISNTPKQVLLYEAFAAPLPAFAHVPLILGPDKKRLSKRHGATSVMEYERQGYAARGDGELPRAARLVARERPGAVHARGAGRRPSRSKASAAATRSSTPRSSTGSTASTSTGCRPARSCRRIAPLLEERRAVAGRVSTARRASGLCRVIELLKPRARKTGRLRRARPASSSRTRSRTTRRPSRSTSEQPGLAAHVTALARGARALSIRSRRPRSRLLCARSRRRAASRRRR